MLQEYLRFPLFPQNLNLLFGLGLLLGDAVSPSSALGNSVHEVFAQVLPPCRCSSWRWGCGRPRGELAYGSGLPGVAAIMLFAIQPVKSTLGFAYVDNGLALFCFAASLAVAVMAAGMMAGRRAHGQDAGMMTGRRTHGQDPGTTSAELESVHLASANSASATTCPRQLPLAALASILASAACGIKYFGVVFAAVLFLVITIINCD